MRNLNRKKVSTAFRTSMKQSAHSEYPCRVSRIDALENHHDKLYVGYVEKKNEIENELEKLGRDIVGGKAAGGNTTYSELRALKDGETYAVNGVYLHEWYFAGLGGRFTGSERPHSAVRLSKVSDPSNRS
jgi:superoxide dismutase